MSSITPIPLPTPIEWETKSAEASAHIQQLNTMFENEPQLKKLYLDALCQVCSEIGIPEREANAVYWLPFLHQQKPLTEFFEEWLIYTPTPKNPGQYIVYWDYLANTESGLALVSNAAFLSWFRVFLNFHGDWINSTSSTGTLADWMTYTGTKDHPFHIEHYERPDPMSPTGGFQSFNQFFLRNLKPGERPLCSCAEQKDVVVAPCDGGIFYLTKGNPNPQQARGESYELPGKSGDQFELLEAIPGYGRHFLGGPLLDILLWFTDYHHFHAPVTGKVIEQGLYHGSYNYDFDDYNPKTHHDPNLPSGSDRVGWYQKLGKHQRYVWVIETEDLGLVAMIAIGFWGVGSIENAIANGASIEKGQYMGHFGYGGSSIVLAFEPGRDLEFTVGDKPVSNPDNPVLMKVRECLGKTALPLK